ncbi:hypothetical protein [Pararhizobium sp. IMCC21322]|uniref:hypothetical protein n=1 Tax=Pararhizobium sp. IMCC21322 TaxID=3067903 RepID=UPI002741623B|nr:hypothetical protein [Pararhizobium sp. IMCC21322]
MSDIKLQNAKANPIAAKIWSCWYRLRFFMDVPSILRLLRYRKLRQTYYDALWSEAAKNIEADIVLNSFGMTRISKAGWSTFVRQHEMMFDSPLMLNLMGNKALTYQLLSDLGAPIVPHLIVSMAQLDKARGFLASHSTIVVKPASGTGGGRGVTTGVKTEGQLMAAAKLAARSDRNLIVEKQVEGQSYRLLFLDGQFIDAIRRDLPVLIGDGQSNLRQLIRQENKRREHQLPMRALSPLAIDKDMKNWMMANDMRLSDVSPNGEAIQIKRATNENDSSGNVNVTQLVNEDIVLRCAELVQNLGVKFAGVDLICQDIAGSFSSENCYVGEVNTTPGLHHHYLIANPIDGNPVAEIALDYLYSQKMGIMTSDNPTHSGLSPVISETQSKTPISAEQANQRPSVAKRVLADELH